MQYTLKPLPYSLTSFGDKLSSKTLEFHWGKHLAAYVNNYNKLREGTEFETLPLLASIIRGTGGLYNNAAQIYNHELYFEELSANTTGSEQGVLFNAIEKQFGSFDTFKIEFSKSALSLFGSGWTWLVLKNNNELQIINTSNADNPLHEGSRPILTLDVWEHAYYLDYQNLRASFIETFWSILNWDVLEERYVIAIK